MRRWTWLSIALALTLATGVARAEDAFRLGGDYFSAGVSAQILDGRIDDAFVAGDRVAVGVDIAGSAHLAGRTVSIDARIGRDLYVAGATVLAAGDVVGDALIAAETLRLDGPVGGDLRVFAREATIAGAIEGNAIVIARRVTIDAPIAGDVTLSAEEVIWGEHGVIEGALTLAKSDVEGDEGAIEDALAEPLALRAEPSVGGRLTDLALEILIVGALAALFGLIAPDWLARLQEIARAAPLHAVALGGVGLSTLLGSIVVLILTGIGAVLAPVSLLGAALLAVLGYLAGVCLLGGLALSALGSRAPTGGKGRALAALLGATLASLIGLAPYLGWLAFLAIALLGAGAIVQATLAPRFFAAESAPRAAAP